VSYSSLETARQPSRKGGCCALTDDGMNAVRRAPTSKTRKKTAGQSKLRDFPISNLPGSVGRTSRPVLNKNWLFGVKGTNGLPLSVAVCSCSRAAASNRTMKISASIATTLLSQSNTRRSKLHFFSAPRCDRQHKLILAVQTESRFRARRCVGAQGSLRLWPRGFFW
jgi:hypothetical protein